MINKEEVNKIFIDFNVKPIILHFDNNDSESMVKFKMKGNKTLIYKLKSIGYINLAREKIKKVKTGWFDTSKSYNDYEMAIRMWTKNYF